MWCFILQEVRLFSNLPPLRFKNEFTFFHIFSVIKQHTHANMHSERVNGGFNCSSSPLGGQMDPFFLFLINIWAQHDLFKT